MRKHFLQVAIVTALLAGCKAAGQFLEELFKERPPAPLDAAEISSDVRLDSTAHILGSFVGEGTSRQVHLLSSDTGFIAVLARRYGPPEASRGDVWGWLARRRVYRLDLDATGAASLTAGAMLAGSPDGHTPVRLWSLLLRGSDCGWRGVQAELVVGEARSGGPSLRGPVVGSFRAPERSASGTPYFRHIAPDPSDSLIGDLLRRTERAMDSVLARTLPSREQLAPREPGERIEINTLEDIDAADVLPFNLEDGRVRYAISLRERRLTAEGEEVMAATVMAWDSAGAWQQFIFRPILLDLHRGRMAARGTGRLPVFWRRLEAVSGFAFGRDYLWMEQVDVKDGSVLWAILEPRSNTVVAAAEVDGPCR